MSVPRSAAHARRRGSCRWRGDIPKWKLSPRSYNGQTNYLTLKNGTFNGGSGITVDSFKIPEQVPIAILTDEWTASSGEAVLVAFRGMENVRTFGAATAGYVSVNTVYQLYDGVQLWLTIAADVAPRTSEVFCEDPISPDVLTNEPEKEAAAWIETVA